MENSHIAESSSIMRVAGAALPLSPRPVIPLLTLFIIAPHLPGENGGVLNVFPRDESIYGTGFHFVSMLATHDDDRGGGRVFQRFGGHKHRTMVMETRLPGCWVSGSAASLEHVNKLGLVFHRTLMFSKCRNTYQPTSESERVALHYCVIYSIFMSATPLEHVNSLGLVFNECRNTGYDCQQVIRCKHDLLVTRLTIVQYQTLAEID
ncbi:hypothetical protein J6590_062376 [Homalodisca vitripennis]|nr:hypothetical protein J6590_062376 [Homalodisca vitripennis]